MSELCRHPDVLYAPGLGRALTQTQEHLLLACQVGISKLVIFINKVDQVDNQEMLDVVKMEMRKLLNEYKFDGDNMPIVMGSALAALEGHKCICRPHFQTSE
jgi:elongation factor Tu